MPSRRRQLAHTWEKPPKNRAIGELERQAYERHARDLADGHKRGLYFDDKAADRAVTFIETFCRHSKGEWAGQLFVLELWQEFIVRSLFGWRRADGFRRFHLAYFQTARKNGKTTLLAAIALLLTVADQEPGGEVYSVATKRDQAKLTFDEAARMVRKSDALGEFLEVVGGRPHSRSDNISCLELASKYEPLAAEADTLDGLNIHGALLDELHAWKDGDLFDVIVTATGARRQPLVIAGTTPGAGQDGICWEQREHAGHVLAGSLEDDGFFAFVAEPDRDADFTKLETWQAGNPNLGVSVKLADLTEKCNRARQLVARQNNFRRLHCGQWTQQVDRWLDLDVWAECGGEFDPSILEGRPCYGGLDLAATTDLSAFVLAFPPVDEENHWFYLLPWCWIPSANLQKRIHRDRVPFDRWAELGHVELTDGDVTDYSVVRARIVEAAARFDIKGIGFDPWNASSLVQQLQDEDGLTMAKISQGVAGMSDPTKTFERLLLQRLLRHGDHPVLRWNAASIATWTDTNGNMKPDRKKSGGRIDLVVASIMAVGLATHHAETGGSIWETETAIA